MHDTRKHLKKARAALRLVRRQIGRGLFKRQDHRLRDVGRMISEIRDAEVRLETGPGNCRRSPVGGGNVIRMWKRSTHESENFVAAFAEWESQSLDFGARAR